MKFLDQTGVSELITLVKKALKPLESMKSSITDVNGIVKSDGSGGFSAATAGTDYAAASHTHTKANITDFPSSMAPTAHKDTHKTGGSDALTPGDIGAAAVEHTHEAEDVNGLKNGLQLKKIDTVILSGYMTDVCYVEDRFIATIDPYTSNTKNYLYSLNGIQWKFEQNSLLPSYSDYGHVCYGNETIVMLKNGGSVYSKDKGVTWTEIGSPFFGVSDYGTSLCYGEGKFLAAGGNKVTSSSDGINWTAVTLPTEGTFGFEYGNGKFVGLGSNTSIGFYSTDGVNWSQVALPTTGRWSVPCYGGGKFVSTDYDSNIAIYSLDGITWSKTTLPSTQYWHRPCYGKDKFVVMAGGYNKSDASAVAAYSLDGIVWKKISMPYSANWKDVFYCKDKFICSSYHSKTGEGAYSLDGIDWLTSYSGINDFSSNDLTQEIKELLAEDSFSADVITSGTLPIVRGGTGADTAGGALSNLGAQAKAKTLTLSLTTTGWSATSKTQTRAATGVTADNIVIVSPAPASQEAYSAAGVKCTAQGANSLTFTCDTVPTEALSVNVVIL